MSVVRPRGVVCVFFAVSLVGGDVGLAAAQEVAGGPTLTFYGTPGLIDMPSAASMEDAQLSLTSSFYGKTLRNTLSFQITPRLTGSFRYSFLEGYFAINGRTGNAANLYDRSFDLHYRLLEEGPRRPALAIGLRDFGGTGIFGSEYLVATKHVTPKLAFSGGIGWGRLGSYGGFRNPLSVLGGRFDTRPGFGGIGDTGKVAFNRWFRGPAALFGGVEWRPSERLSFVAEYSSDAYVQESARMGFHHRSPFNFGVTYRFDNGVDLAGYYLYGSQIGVRLSYSLNPKHPRYPGGREGAPPSVSPRLSYSAAAASWNLDQPGRHEALRQAVAGALKAQDLGLEALELGATHATIRLRNSHYDAAPQAIGRAARALTHVLPPAIETMTIVPVINGIPVSAVTIRRSDLEELEFAPDGSWQSYARAEIVDGAGPPPAPADFAAGAYPDFSWRLGAYLRPSLFDPDAPIRANLGVQLALAYAPAPGMILSGAVRKPIIGNLDQVSRVSNSVLPHVRSDAALYDKNSDLEIPYLTGEYFFRPGRNLYGRVTAGYLERMYGGLSGELLWAPVSSRLALGVEVNYARQRDFNVLFGFQDYHVITGHASAYYDLGGGYRAELDAGRYLAGDWGATLALDRTFANGWRVGAFMTLTNVSFDDFGEGSFDKGIRISVPLSWLSGDPSQKGFGTTIRPVTRDGGARLDVRNRLYDLTQGYRNPALNDRWGRFWR